MIRALIVFRQGFILKTLFAAVNKKAIKAETKTKGITGMKSLSLRVGTVFLSIGLLVVVRCLERCETKWANCYERLPAYCNADRQGIVDASRNIVRGWIESGYKEKSTIEMGATFGHRWYPKSGNIPIIILIGVVVWGAAIIFVLGLILYQVVIEPLVQKKKVKTE